jgi:hypothetical protein
VLARLARTIVPLASVALTTVAACGALDANVGPASARCVDADSNPDVSVSFAATIRPWMNRSAQDPEGHGCKACHYTTATNPTGIEIGGLDLTTLASLRRGGVTSGANIVVPGRPCESALVQKLRGDYGPVPVRMPKDGPPYWPSLWIQAVSDWIAEGAHGADDE